MGMFAIFTVTDGTTSTVAQQPQAAVRPQLRREAGGAEADAGAVQQQERPFPFVRQQSIVTTEAGQAIQVIKATYSPTTDITKLFRVKERPVV